MSHTQTANHDPGNRAQDARKFSEVTRATCAERHTSARARTVRCTPSDQTASGSRWRGDCQNGQAESHTMSQKTVQLVIGRLLTDEELRSHFVNRPLETLTKLQQQGFELTRDEIDAIVESDPEIWPSMAARIHPRLQRCSLRY